MLNSQFLQRLKILQYRNHRISIFLHVLNEHKMIFLFLTAVNFALYISAEEEFSLVPAYVAGAFCFVIMLLQYRIYLRIYNSLRESAYKLVEEEKDKLWQFDKEDYVKWATMENYILYEKKSSDKYSKEHKLLEGVISCGAISVIVMSIIIVLMHLTK